MLLLFAANANAQTLWLATRIERKLNNASGVTSFGKQLTDRFPQSREANRYIAPGSLWAPSEALPPPTTSWIAVEYSQSMSIVCSAL